MGGGVEDIRVAEERVEGDMGVGGEQGGHPPGLAGPAHGLPGQGVQGRRGEPPRRVGVEDAQFFTTSQFQQGTGQLLGIAAQAGMLLDGGGQVEKYVQLNSLASDYGLYVGILRPPLSTAIPGDC